MLNHRHHHLLELCLREACPSAAHFCSGHGKSAVEESPTRLVRHMCTRGDSVNPQSQYDGYIMEGDRHLTPGKMKRVRLWVPTIEESLDQTMIHFAKLNVLQSR